MERLRQNLPQILGWALTVAYLAGAGTYVAGVAEKPWALPANEFGDFVAGIFAPIAVVWLIAGFWLQARELRLQLEEMRLTVGASNALAEQGAARLQREAILVRPALVVRAYVLAATGPTASVSITNRFVGRESAEAFDLLVVRPQELVDTSAPILSRSRSYGVLPQRPVCGRW